MLVGLCGLAGCGKNTVAEILQERRNFTSIAFADPIYAAVAAVTGLSASELADRSVKEAPLPWLGKSPRELLQTLGTEWGREGVHQEIWVRRAMQRATAIVAAGGHIAITDCRFENEAQAIRRAGGSVWQVRRQAAGLAGAAGRHASEAGIPERLIDLRIENNSTLHDLEAAVEAAWATLQDDTIKVSPR